MLRFSANQYTGIAEANTSAEQRMKLLQGSIKQILEKPFGGDIERKYYHNLFLDIARISGIIPMGFMVSFVQMGTVALQTSINTFGTNTIVAHTAARKASSIFMLPWSAAAARRVTDTSAATTDGCSNSSMKTAP